MNALLERIAGVAARRHWIFIISWVIILGGLLAAKNAIGGEYKLTRNNDEGCCERRKFKAIAPGDHLRLPASTGLADSTECKRCGNFS